MRIAAVGSMGSLTGIPGPGFFWHRLGPAAHSAIVVYGSPVGNAIDSRTLGPTHDSRINTILP